MSAHTFDAFNMPAEMVISSTPFPACIALSHTRYTHLSSPPFVEFLSFPSLFQHVLFMVWSSVMHKPLNLLNFEWPTEFCCDLHDLCLLYYLSSPFRMCTLLKFSHLSSLGFGFRFWVCQHSFIWQKIFLCIFFISM